MMGWLSGLSDGLLIRVFQDNIGSNPIPIATNGTLAQTDERQIEDLDSQDRYLKVPPLYSQNVTGQHVGLQNRTVQVRDLVGLPFK